MLIQTKFPHRISLSQAAQITGYHQDYLGLLCRLGKMRASKIGRNWYTTKSDIQDFLKVPLSVEERLVIHEFSPEIEDSGTNTPQTVLTDEVETESETSESAEPISLEQVLPHSTIRSIDSVFPKIERAVEPVIVENLVIDSLDGLPIKLVKKPVEPQHNTLQTLILRTKLDQLKHQVLEFSGFMDDVSDKLIEHDNILERHEKLLAQRADLTSKFSSAIDVVPKTSEAQVRWIAQPKEGVSNKVSLYWLWPAMAVCLVAIASLAALWVNRPEPLSSSQAIRYTPNSSASPQVAGDATEIPQ